MLRGLLLGCQSFALLNLGRDFPAKLVGKPVLDGVGMGRDGHTHVLQLTNHFGVVEIQLAGELINSQFSCHE
jgi:hypothetical protein